MRSTVAKKRNEELPQWAGLCGAQAIQLDSDAQLEVETLLRMSEELRLEKDMQLSATAQLGFRAGFPGGTAG